MEGRDGYFTWLTSLIGEPYFDKGHHSMLLRVLYQREFWWTVENDSNRAGDGLYLRKTYEEETGLSAGIEGPCRMLEMLVALAKRIEDSIMYDPDEGDRTYMWFWEMMGNLDLIQFDDAHFDADAWSDANHILDILLERNYACDGNGGLFPLQNSNYDQRKTEIWWQMEKYFMENYYAE